MADDRTEFERLYRSVHADLHGYTVRRFGLEGADDIVAETLTTVYARWNDAPPTLDRQRAWAFGIAHHMLLAAYRRRPSALRSVPIGTPEREATASTDDDVAALDRARRLLDQLPIAERDAVYLTVIEGFSAAEAGRILNCSTTATTSRLARARVRLRAILESEKGKEAVKRVIS